MGRGIFSPLLPSRQYNRKFSRVQQNVPFSSLYWRLHPRPSSSPLSSAAEAVRLWSSRAEASNRPGTKSIQVNVQSLLLSLAGNKDTQERERENMNERWWLVVFNDKRATFQTNTFVSFNVDMILQRSGGKKVAIVFSITEINGERYALLCAVFFAQKKIQLAVRTQRLQRENERRVYAYRASTDYFRSFEQLGLVGSVHRVTGRKLLKIARTL